MSLRIDKATAWGNYRAAEAAIDTAELARDNAFRIVNSRDFRNAVEFLGRLDDELSKITEDVENGSKLLSIKVDALNDDLADTIRKIDSECNNVIMEVEGQLQKVKAELKNFSDSQQVELRNFNLELQNVLSGIKAQAVINAKDFLEAVKSDDTLLVAARRGLDSFDQLQRGAFDSLDGLMRHTTGDLVNVEHVSLYGLITANANTQAPFVITIEGRAGGVKPFRFQLEWIPWRPGADDTDLFKRLADMVMQWLNGKDVGLNKIQNTLVA